MNEPPAGEVASTLAEAPGDAQALIASLRAAGARCFDPVRWRYLETLAARAAAMQGKTERLLGARLEQALLAYQERFARARSQAEEMAARGARQFPHASGDLERLFAAGDFKGLRRFLASLASRDGMAPLGALVRQLERQFQENADARTAHHAATRMELKTVRQFRSTWSKLSIGKEVARALEQAPRDAGPINSHMLVLRSLALMREVSPDYLNRFMTYADTLLSLDQPEKEKPGTPKKAAAARTTRK
jgi:hypothetical protein